MRDDIRVNTFGELEANRDTARIGVRIVMEPEEAP